MYTPSDFSVSDDAWIHEFLARGEMGILISQSSFEPQATHLPYTFSTSDDNGLVVEVHLAKENPHLAHLKAGKNTLFIVCGPHAYVSSSVYSHHNVPTMNYQTVHLYASIEWLSPTETELHMHTLVERFEKNREKPLRYRDFAREMVHSYMKELQGLRLHVYRVEATNKISQNRNATDQQAIVDDLSQRTEAGAQKIAAEMKQNRG